MPEQDVLCHGDLQQHGVDPEVNLEADEHRSTSRVSR